MNITQIFSGASLKANLDEYLIRHDLIRSPPVNLDQFGNIGDRETDTIKNAVCICIKNILLNYSQEIYDYFRYEVDYLLNQIYEETAPKSRKRRRLLTFSEKLKLSERQTNPHTQLPTPKKKQVCLRSRTGYLMFCAYLRENVPNYRSLKPQRLWHELAPEAKHEYVMMGKQSKPLKWSQKTKFKSKFGRETFQNKLECMENSIENKENEEKTNTIKQEPLSEEEDEMSTEAETETESDSSSVVLQCHKVMGMKRPRSGLIPIYLSSSSSSSSSSSDEDSRELEIEIIAPHRQTNDVHPSTKSL